MLMSLCKSLILLHCCTGLLAQQSDEGKAAKELRLLRNEFVHELHLNPELTQEKFDEKWQNIMKLLTTLAKFAGPSAQQLFESETQKILTQAIDAKKEREFTDEFNLIYGQLEEVYIVYIVHACILYVRMCLHVFLPCTCKMSAR
jgi:hypothetical protein